MEHPVGDKYTIFSGGASGADQFAEKLALNYGCHMDIKIGPNHPRKKTITPISLEDLKQANPVILRANQTLGRKDITQSPDHPATELIQRNFFIIKEATAVYAFGYLRANNTQAYGGTGWTAQMALDAGKQVYFSI